MFKSILSSLYERVVKAYKSTLLAIGLVAATVIVEQLQAAALPVWAKSIVGVAAAILTFYKGKQPAPELVPPAP
jgi:hypothetical protein